MVIAAEPDRDIAVTGFLENSVHRMAKQLFQIGGLSDCLAEAFGQADFQAYFPRAMHYAQDTPPAGAGGHSRNGAP